MGKKRRERPPFVGSSRLLLLKSEICAMALAAAHDGAPAVYAVVALLQHGLKVGFALGFGALDVFEDGAAAHFLVSHLREAVGGDVAQRGIGFEIVEEGAHGDEKGVARAMVCAADFGVQGKRGGGVHAEGADAVVHDAQAGGILGRGVSVGIVPGDGEFGALGPLHCVRCRVAHFPEF